ncbi:hypothetical protein EVAR_99398_1 [Eumeta japonica]|uniref:Uncharacterized protein n=1 Tax=Eumeta variegata TaxID=151549 RepID=A0A4C1SP24_EUMVA|nr:hypothetical protein EVAR_99398_1 [Eumeta japonica]
MGHAGPPPPPAARDQRIHLNALERRTLYLVWVSGGASKTRGVAREAPRALGWRHHRTLQEQVARQREVPQASSSKVVGSNRGHPGTSGAGKEGAADLGFRSSERKQRRPQGQAAQQGKMSRILGSAATSH